VYAGSQGVQWIVLAASEAACSRRAWAVVPPIAKPVRSAESVREPGEGRLAWAELVLGSGVASVLDLLDEASAESIAVMGKAAGILSVIGFSPFWGRQIMVLPTQMEVVPKILSKD
jgi:hypothetical protein